VHIRFTSLHSGHMPLVWIGNQTFKECFMGLLEGKVETAPIAPAGFRLAVTSGRALLVIRSGIVRLRADTGRGWRPERDLS
jgi:hypothetical protein